VGVGVLCRRENERKRDASVRNGRRVSSTKKGSGRTILLGERRDEGVVGEKSDVGDGVDLSGDGGREEKSLSRLLSSVGKSSEDLENLLPESLENRTRPRTSQKRQSPISSPL